MGLWVAELIISPQTAQKIAVVHGVAADEIRDAVQCVSGLPFTPDDDPERGLRYVVTTYIRQTRYDIVLYPVSDPLGDVYALGSAYRC